MTNEKNQSSPAPNEVLITRTVRFPVEQVFRLWTDPVHLPRWFAPRGCSICFKELDIRVGGRFHSCISAPGHKDCWCIGTYLEIDAPRKIVYTMAVSDEQGHRCSAAEAGMDPEWPDETTVTIRFRDLGGITELELHQTADTALAKRTGAHPSWLQMLDLMEELLQLPTPTA